MNGLLNIDADKLVSFLSDLLYDQSDYFPSLDDIELMIGLLFQRTDRADPSVGEAIILCREYQLKLKASFPPAF